MKDVFVEGMRRLSPLVYVDGFFQLNIAAAIDVRYLFFKG